MKKILSFLLITVLIFSVISINAAVSEANDIVFGDANGDKVVDVKDVLTIRQYHVDSLHWINKTNADVDASGKVTTSDILLIRKYLANLVSTLVPVGYTTTEPEPTYAVTNTYKISELSDCMYLCGRSVVSDTTLKMDQTASGLKFKANCEGDIAFNITSNNGGYVDIIVDEDYENIHRVSLKSGSNTATYKQKLSLAMGEHTFTVLKATERVRNKFVLNSLTINGVKSASAPTQKEIKLEFYGDSITAGYGNLCDGGSGKWDWPYQDGCMTYASYCSYELNADFAVAATSGFGVLGGFSNGSTNDTYDKFFDYSYVAEKLPWSRANYAADAIIINYGTNDDSRDGDNLDSTAFELKCREIVEGMHKDNPNAKIVWIIGMNYINDSKPVVKTISKLADEYDYLYFKKFQARQSGGDSHPNVANHKVAGHELAEYLKTDILKK